MAALNAIIDHINGLPVKIKVKLGRCSVACMGVSLSIRHGGDDNGYKHGESPTNCSLFFQ